MHAGAKRLNFFYPHYNKGTKARIALLFRLWHTPGQTGNIVSVNHFPYELKSDNRVAIHDDYCYLRVLIKVSQGCLTVPVFKCQVLPIQYLYTAPKSKMWISGTISRGYYRLRNTFDELFDVLC